MEGQVRTLGDGIDNSLLYAQGVAVTVSDPITIDKNAFNSILKSLRPVEINSNLITLVPKYIPSERKMPKYLVKKPKEPKFIPYEPYKAAVKPITSAKTSYGEIEKTKLSKSDIEIHELVNQMSEMRRMEMNKLNVVEEDNDGTLQLRMQWKKEKQAFETDIKNLRETNSHLENQLKFQAQVCIFT